MVWREQIPSTAPRKYILKKKKKMLKSLGSADVPMLSRHLLPRLSMPCSRHPLLPRCCSVLEVAFAAISFVAVIAMAFLAARWPSAFLWPGFEPAAKLIAAALGYLTSASAESGLSPPFIEASLSPSAAYFHRSTHLSRFYRYYLSSL